jgi:multiple sugar transport system permease protein
MRNYYQVLDYLAMHGNGLINTFIYCSLAVLCALIVNPLAAYALSRFRLPGTYKILLFCMATMAFPGEVTMIPGFLLLKRFPLWPIITGLAVTIVLFLILEKFLSKWKENWRALLALSAGLVSGAIIFPALAPEYTTVSLLNNFAALVLPGMANGFSIFLLKGFFDSMPKELYEAAEIDGAGEWTKFWMLTMNLSKPILAVIALGAFTSSYSAFMMALIIIPDQKMWTIMVWIFQLQSQSSQPVVYASLVVAAIPTFIIFVLCQNVIMRGIVVPTEK